MKHKTVLVTGSTDGIGKITALEIAKLGAKVIIHGRTEDKALETVAALAKKVAPGELDWVGGEFTSFNSVRKMAAEIKERYGRLDVLINNAGVYQKEKQLTADGNETTFQVNHLSHFLLTCELLGLLESSDDARIINISSVTHFRAKLDFKNINCEKNFDAYNQYAVSKLANIMFTLDLAARFSGTNLKVNSVHPGIAATKLLGLPGGLPAKSLLEYTSAAVSLASEPRAARYNGLYFSKTPVNSVEPSADALNEKLRKKLWTMSEKLTGISYPKAKRKISAVVENA